MTFEDRVLKMIRNELARDAETRLDQEDVQDYADILDALSDINDKVDDVYDRLNECCDDENPWWNRKPKKKDDEKSDDESEDDDPWYKKFVDWLLDHLDDILKWKPPAGQEFPDPDSIDGPLSPFPETVPVPGIPSPTPVTPLPFPGVGVPALPMGLRDPGILLPLVAMLSNRAATRNLQEAIDLLPLRTATSLHASKMDPTALCCDAIIDAVRSEGRRSRAQMKLERV